MNFRPFWKTVLVSQSPSKKLFAGCSPFHQCHTLVYGIDKRNPELFIMLDGLLKHFFFLIAIHAEH